MVGEWIGTSTWYKDGEISRQGAAYQSIDYDLDQHIIVINLNSEMLKLHTLINYDTDTGQYYYHPYSTSGSGRYPARIVEGQLVVSSDEDTRYIFQRMGEDTFREYGEQRVDGEWSKTFEDIYTDSK